MIELGRCHRGFTIPPPPHFRRFFADEASREAFYSRFLHPLGSHAVFHHCNVLSLPTTLGTHAPLLPSLICRACASTRLSLSLMGVPPPRLYAVARSYIGCSAVGEDGSCAPKASDGNRMIGLTNGNELMGEGRRDAPSASAKTTSPMMGLLTQLHRAAEEMLTLQI